MNVVLCVLDDTDPIVTSGGRMGVVPIQWSRGLFFFLPDPLITRNGQNDSSVCFSSSNASIGRGKSISTLFPRRVGSPTTVLSSMFVFEKSPPACPQLIITTPKLTLYPFRFTNYQDQTLSFVCLQFLCDHGSRNILCKHLVV